MNLDDLNTRVLGIAAAALAVVLAGLVGAIVYNEKVGFGPGKSAVKGLGRIMEEPEGDLPPTVAASKFLEQIGRQSYPVARPPIKPARLRWDFSRRKTYGYDFTQVLESSNRMGNQQEDMKQDAEFIGSLLMRGQGDRTADMILQDINVKMKMDMKGMREAGAPDTMTSEFPSMVIQGVGENGSMENAANQGNLMLSMLFPLPPNPLGVGDSIVVPAELPFNAMGSILQARGESTITLSGYVNIKGRECARLETDIDISQLDVPPELEGTYRIRVKGKGVSYFDVKDGCFESVEQAIVMSIRADVPTPKMNFPGSDSKVKMPETMRMVMDSDNLIKVGRNKAKER